MHSKTMMVDDEVCSIGSANFDDRSAYYNFESNVMLFSKGIIEKSVYAFDEDVSSSDELHQGDYSGIVPSIKMFICNIVRPLA